MAERRMFAKSIVLSDAFLDMPMSARCLYFTLGMLADDDGFIGSPKSIMRQCGASQDDMGILLQKRYILAWDSGVIVIKHWRMNNFLRNDRHTSTTYVEEKSTLAIDDKGAYTEAFKFGIPSGNQVVYPGKDSIGKDSIDKDIMSHCDTDIDNEALQQVSDLYNSICVSFPKVTKLSEKRRKAVKAILKEYSLDEIKEAFKKAEESDFMKTGNWASFDWMMNKNNLLKIIEGNYSNKTKQKSNQFNSYGEKRNYDFEALEKSLLGG